eukprot:GEMP01013578.1.p1 GENE.GEMP01013578.1~~GEMP01013578.1.p1  ORF type:complete len:796 (+),score=205.06 GEMP01013578.1:217-2604(+)
MNGRASIHGQRRCVEVSSDVGFRPSLLMGGLSRQSMAGQRRTSISGLHRQHESGPSRPSMLDRQLMKPEDNSPSVVGSTPKPHWNSYTNSVLNRGNSSVETTCGLQRKIKLLEALLEKRTGMIDRMRSDYQKEIMILRSSLKSKGRSSVEEVADDVFHFSASQYADESLDVKMVYEEVQANLRKEMNQYMAMQKSNMAAVQASLLLARLKETYLAEMLKMTLVKLKISNVNAFVSRALQLPLRELEPMEDTSEDEEDQEQQDDHGEELDKDGLRVSRITEKNSSIMDEAHAGDGDNQKCQRLTVKPRKSSEVTAVALFSLVTGQLDKRLEEAKDGIVKRVKQSNMGHVDLSPKASVTDIINSMDAQIAKELSYEMHVLGEGEVAREDVALDDLISCILPKTFIASAATVNAVCRKLTVRRTTKHGCATPLDAFPGRTTAVRKLVSHSKKQHNRSALADVVGVAPLGKSVSRGKRHGDNSADPSRTTTERGRTTIGGLAAVEDKEDVALALDDAALDTGDTFDAPPRSHSSSSYSSSFDVGSQTELTMHDLDVILKQSKDNVLNCFGVIGSRHAGHVYATPRGVLPESPKRDSRTLRAAVVDTLLKDANAPVMEKPLACSGNDDVLVLPALPLGEYLQLAHQEGSGEGGGWSSRGVSVERDGTDGGAMLEGWPARRMVGPQSASVDAWMEGRGKPTGVGGVERKGGWDVSQRTASMMAAACADNESKILKCGAMKYYVHESPCVPAPPSSSPRGPRSDVARSANSAEPRKSWKLRPAVAPIRHGDCSRFRSTWNPG